MEKITVHFFKHSGKWYTTMECEWTSESQEFMDIGEWQNALKASLPIDRLLDMKVVIIDSPLGFPVMIDTEVSK